MCQKDLFQSFAQKGDETLATLDTQRCTQKQPRTAPYG